MSNKSEFHKNDVHLSKLLSFVLRHGAAKVGIQIDANGFVLVKDLLKISQFKNYTISDIKRVVENNDKKRFILVEGVNGQQLLKACQGHSIKSVELELPEIKPGEIEQAVHGE